MRWTECVARVVRVKLPVSTPWRHQGGVEVELHSFITSARLRRYVVSVIPQPLFPRGKNPGTHWVGSWVCPRVVLDVFEKRYLAHTGIWTRDRPALGIPSTVPRLPRVRHKNSLKFLISKPEGNRAFAWAVVIVCRVDSSGSGLGSSAGVFESRG
jgi:hypothetical protein